MLTNSSNSCALRLRLPSEVNITKKVKKIMGEASRRVRLAYRESMKQAHYQPDDSSAKTAKLMLIAKR